MKKTICFDFGNTRQKAALFLNGVFQEEQVLDSAALTESAMALVNRWQPHQGILSSVINHSEALPSALEASIPSFHVLNHESQLPFSTPVGKPETIGADRLALAAAAVHFHPGKNNLVIGLGTAITYNFINCKHQFLGGSISPGMQMRFRALQEFTAKLPLVKPSAHYPLLGYDTKTNILSGVLLGMAREIDGIIGDYAEKFDNFNVSLTGGDSAYFAQHLKNRIFADPQLIFKGLYAIGETNCQLPQ